MRHEWKSDGPWMMLWPVTMAIGIWGIGLIYQGLTTDRPTLWVGISLLVGGGYLSGRWVAQARILYRSVRRARRTERG